MTGCVLSIFLFQAFTITPEPHFTNLQILPKDISMHDLDSVMHHFTASLGVKCNFCHIMNEGTKKMDFAADDKAEKNIARKMMLMSIDINKNYFRDMDDMAGNAVHDSAMMKNQDTAKANQHFMDTSMITQSSKYMLSSVTCFTCHRGEAHPEVKIPAHQEGAPAAPSKTADNK